jgi:cysteine-rich repeat protein
MRIFAIIFLVLTGCLNPASEICGNGGVCPPGLRCVDTAHTTTGGQICAAGTCGNGVLDPGEFCDDGNNKSGDGCPADCSNPCGDGVLDPGEVCDDGNHIDGDGCAADCKSRDGVLLISPASVAFAIDEGDPAPADVIVTVQLGSRDDALKVGGFADDPVPPWLAISETSTAAESILLDLHVTDAAVVGERAASVPLTIAHADNTSEVFDLPVSYHIQASDLAMQAAPTALTFTAVAGDPSPPAQSVALTFNGDALRVTSAPPWLTVTGASPTTFTVAVATTNLAAGTALAGDIVFTTTRGAVARTAQVHVEASVVAPGALTITTPSTLAFAALAGGAVPAAQSITVAFTGATIELVSAPPWLTVTAPADPTASPATFTLAASTTAFAAGAQTGDLVVRTTHNLVHQDATVHVTYQLFAPPELQFAAPYVGYTGRPGTLSVNGVGFQPGLPIVIGIGDLRVPVTPTSAFQVTLAYPGLAAGRYPITLVDPPAAAPDLPELVIVDPPAFTYQALPLSGGRTRIVYDAERQALYAVNPNAQQIERFAFTGGAWAALPPIAVPKLTDIALTPNGRSLIVVDEAEINQMSLQDGAFALTPLAPLPHDACNLFANAAAAGNGKLFVTSNITGTGFCPTYIYDLRDGSIASTSSFDSGFPVASADGNHVLIDGHNFSETFSIYDTRTDSLSGATVNISIAYAISLSGDAGRVIMDDTQVYDRALGRLGNVAYHGSFATIASTDGRRAFSYAQDAPHTRIEVYDLDGALQTGAMYPLLSSLPVADNVNGANEYAMALALTPDDAVMFVAGASKLLVVPLR